MGIVNRESNNSNKFTEEAAILFLEPTRVSCVHRSVKQRIASKNHSEQRGASLPEN